MECIGRLVHEREGMLSVLFLILLHVNPCVVMSNWLDQGFKLPSWYHGGVAGNCGQMCPLWL